MKWRASDDLTFFANYSTISETEFSKDEIGALDQTGASLHEPLKTKS